MLRCFFSQPAFSVPSWRLGEAGRHGPRDTSPITMLLDLAADTQTHKAFFFSTSFIQAGRKWRWWGQRGLNRWLHLIVYIFSICSLIEACVVPHSVCFTHTRTLPGFSVVNTHTTFCLRLRRLEMKGERGRGEAADTNNNRKQIKQSLWRGNAHTHTHTYSLRWQGSPPLFLRSLEETYCVLQQPSGIAEAFELR